jgi:hypothetical protein
MVLKSSVSGDIMSRSPLKVNQRFDSIFMVIGYLLDLFFDTEDGGAMLLRNVDLL